MKRPPQRPGARPTKAARRQNIKDSAAIGAGALGAPAFFATQAGAGAGNAAVTQLAPQLGHILATHPYGAPMAITAGAALAGAAAGAIKAHRAASPRQFGKKK